MRIFNTSLNSEKIFYLVILKLKMVPIMIICYFSLIKEYIFIKLRTLDLCPTLLHRLGVEFFKISPNGTDYYI